MHKLAQFVLIVLYVGTVLAGLSASGYALYWLYQEIGLWIILLGSLVLPLGPLAALLITLPITMPLMAYVKRKPGGMFEDCAYRLRQRPSLIPFT